MYVAKAGKKKEKEKFSNLELYTSTYVRSKERINFE